MNSIEQTKAALSCGEHNRVNLWHISWQNDRKSQYSPFGELIVPRVAAKESEKRIDLKIQKTDRPGFVSRQQSNFETFSYGKAWVRHTGQFWDDENFP